MTLKKQSITLAPSYTTIAKPTEEQRAQAVQGALLTDVIQHLYSLALFDTQSNKIFEDGTLDPAGRTTKSEYYFTVPPKVLEMSEPFATNIVGTQNGGKYVESYGSIIKDLRISGTTGLRPNKVNTNRIEGFTDVTGIRQDQLNVLAGNNLTGEIRRIPQNERTGYDDIIFLQNIFRKYSDLKASDALAGRIVMLWRNLKDADYWIVEPIAFSKNQNSQSPLTYEYNIQLKTLARFDFSYVLPEDPLAEQRSRTRLLSRVQEYSQNLLGIFLTISTQVNRAQGALNFLTNLVVSPVLNVLNGLTAVKTAVNGFSPGFVNNIRTLEENCREALERLTEELSPQDAITNSVRRTQRLCYRMLTEAVVNDSVGTAAASRIERYASAYRRPGTTTTPSTGPASSPSYIGSAPVPEGVSSTIIGPGEDIRDISSRTLGDRTRWRELVVLNALRFPYIATDGRDGVLAPGDSILYPAAAGVASSSIAVNASNDQTELDAALNGPVQQAYGRDLRLRSVQAGLETVSDIAVNQRGDFATVQGIPNVKQAILLKFSTEQGELPAHPRYGAKFPIGHRATPTSFNELRINTLATISMDPRIASIYTLTFVVVQDTLAVSAKLGIQGTQDALTTTFALRRF
jgi:hypothetical protein